MKRFLQGLLIVAGSFILSSLIVQAAGTAVFPTGGGTGTTTPPSSNQILIGNGTGGYKYVTANQANGPLLLDASGNITATIIPRLDYLSHLSSIVLQQGELAFATDTNQLYIGDAVGGVGTAGGLLMNPFQASSTKIYYNGGSVGIGSTSPYGMLGVQVTGGSGNSGIVVRDRATGSGDMFSGYDGTGVKQFYVDYSGNVTAPSTFNLSTGSHFARNCNGASDCIGVEGANGFTGYYWDGTDGSESLQFRVADQDSPGNTVGTINVGGDLQMLGSVKGANIVALSSSATSTFAGAITVAGQATSTFTKGVSAAYLNLTGSVATNTAAQGINITRGCFAISGTCISSSGGGGGSGTVTSVATNNGLTGGTITTTGTIGLNTAGLSTNGLVTWDGSNLVATGTPKLTVGNIVSTTTTASTFAGTVGVGTTSPYALFAVQGLSNIPQFIVQGNSTQTADLFDAIKSNGTKAVIFGNTLTTNKNNIGIYDFNQAGYTVGSAGSTNYDYGGILDIHAADDTGFLAKLYNTTFSSTIPVFDYFADNSGNFIQSSETGTMSLATGGYPSPRLTIAANGNTQIGFINKAVDTGLWTIPANTLTVTQIGSVNPFAVQSAGGANLVQVLNGGNVGIGTSTPYSMLSVAGQVVGQNFVATSTTATSSFAGVVGIASTSPFAMLGITPNATSRDGIAIRDRALANGNMISGYLDTGGTPAFAVDYSGNVTAPSAFNLGVTGSQFTRNCVGNYDCIGIEGAGGRDAFMWDGSDTEEGLAFQLQDNTVGTIDPSGNLSMNGVVTAGGLSVGTTSVTNTVQIQGPSAHSATKGTCFRAKAVGANSYVFWWFDSSAVPHYQTTSCSGIGTTTISND